METPIPGHGDFGDGTTSIPIDAEERTCTWRFRRCSPRHQAIAVEYASPEGTLRLTSVGAYYWQGFTYGFGVWFEGKLGDQEVVLSAERANAPMGDRPMAPSPPGHYRTGSSWDALYGRLLTCERTVELSNVELVIEQHDVPEVLEAGAAIRLSGQLIVSDVGWALSIPFAIEQICDVSVSL